MNFDLELLEEIVYMSPGDAWEGYEVLENRMVGQTRWSLIYLTVFRFEGKCYAIRSYRPATESVDCKTFYSSKPEVIEVTPTVVPMTIYVDNRGINVYS